jgi:hypothetical protein
MNQNKNINSKGEVQEFLLLLSTIVIHYESLPTLIHVNLFIIAYYCFIIYLFIYELINNLETSLT